MDTTANKMVLVVPSHLLARIHAHAEAAYPEEGAGLLLGSQEGEKRRVESLLEFPNARESPARRNRYLITPQDMIRAEEHAAQLGLDILGVFHSHPDHPNQPSEYDREWALPWFSYLITSVKDGSTQGSRSWRLLEDRTSFQEERITIEDA